MSEHVGEKTEQATPKRLEEALKKGQFARSPEIQTVFVLCAGLIALRMAGVDTWQRLAIAVTGIFGELGRITLAQGPSCASWRIRPPTNGIGGLPESAAT